MLKFLCIFDVLNVFRCRNKLEDFTMTWGELGTACAFPATIFAIIILGLLARYGLTGFYAWGLAIKDWFWHDDVRRTIYEMEAMDPAERLIQYPPAQPRTQELEIPAEVESPFIQPRTQSQSQTYTERPTTSQSAARSRRSSGHTYTSNISGSSSTVTPARSRSESTSPPRSSVFSTYSHGTTNEVVPPNLPSRNPTPRRRRRD